MTSPACCHALFPCAKPGNVLAQQFFQMASKPVKSSSVETPTAAHIKRLVVGSAARQAAPKLPANVQQKGLCAAIMRGEF